MLFWLLRRLLLIPPLLLGVHALAWWYATVARRLHSSRNPFVAPLLGDESPLLPGYLAALRALLTGQWGTLPGGRGTLSSALGEAALASLGLLGLVLALSLLLGLLLGLAAVRVEPQPHVARWMLPFATVGLSMPAFYIGILLLSSLIFYTLRTFNRPPLPFDGFGWDRHLLLPTLALAVRPTVQLAYSSAQLLSAELRQPHVVAERSLGFSWRRIRWRRALRNVLAPLILSSAGSVRLLLGELLLVELLFRWPGVGRLLALTLVPPALSSDSGGVWFLHPTLLPLLLICFALLFALLELGAGLLARAADPRLRAEMSRG